MQQPIAGVLKRLKIWFVFSTMCCAKIAFCCFISNFFPDSAENTNKKAHPINQMSFTIFYKLKTIYLTYLSHALA